MICHGNIDTFDIILDSSNIDWECSMIAHLMDDYVLNNVEELLDAECSKTAIVQFFCVVEACCEHFISDEHWGEFDDMYYPDYSMLATYRRFADAIKNVSMPADCVDLFKANIKKISLMESYTDYGIPMFVSDYEKEFGVCNRGAAFFKFKTIYYEIKFRCIERFINLN